MKQETPNPFSDRLAAFAKAVAKRKLDAALVFGQSNVRGLTNVDSDNACLLVRSDGKVALYTDFRYVPMVHRVAPWLKVIDISKLPKAKLTGKVGLEFSVSHARFEKLRKDFKKAKFVDILPDLKPLRAVKTADEIAKLRASEKLACEIWREASAKFRAGMTELDMARIIQTMMIERGEGEAFDTIVCVGANAAECHHVPDETVWNGREPILVDMGVKLDGYCSDLTRNYVPGFLEPSQLPGHPKPSKPSKLYRKVYDLVLKANRAAIAAAKPGVTCRTLDRVARKVIADGGFGKCFGHSLGHGVGIDIHEAPTVGKKDNTVLKPGMVVTIEPGVYLEGNLGVRIEDLILITETGCEVLSGLSAK